MKLTKVLCPSSQIPLKCPYAMNPQFIIVHNTDNDASAMSEVSYMLGNRNEVSFHYAIDDSRIVQGVEENRNTWNCANSYGNRNGIAIEICYSKSGGEKFNKAENLTAEFIASILKRYGWGIDKVKKHQDFNGKYCPHRTLDYGWDRFVAKVKSFLDSDFNAKNEADQILHVGSKVKFNGVFKIDEAYKPNSKYKNGYIGCYKTCYGAPCGVNDYIPCGPLATCDSSGNNVNYNGKMVKGGYWKSDAIFVVKDVKLPTNIYKNGIAVLEADGVQFRCDCGPLYEIRDN